jgi:hypothetical protein
VVGSDVFMLTRACDYGNPESMSRGKESHDSHNSLHIEKFVGDTLSCIPKGVFKRSSHNPSSRATLNYSIFEYLAQTPCAMLALQVI